jgi:hypothetical protein
MKLEFYWKWLRYKNNNEYDHLGLRRSEKVLKMIGFDISEVERLVKLNRINEAFSYTEEHLLCRYTSKPSEMSESMMKYILEMRRSK